jgi:hypothetical protein
VTPKRPKVEPIRNPTLFEMDKLEHAGSLANSLIIERPYCEHGLLLKAQRMAVTKTEFIVLQKAA